jgi:hypothetical protein
MESRIPGRLIAVSVGPFKAPEDDREAAGACARREKTDE